MDPLVIKEERTDDSRAPARTNAVTVAPSPAEVIDLSSSDSDDGGGGYKKQKKDGSVPLGFLNPLSLEGDGGVAAASSRAFVPGTVGRKQFWKAGDYDWGPIADSMPLSSAVGMDHVRVHPKFLHSNATSHKWALGAFAELLDNSLDEVCHGATVVNIDMIYERKDGTKMLLIEDNGGGMDPDKMRQCMSLGYSAKSKIPNTIGQYGNGFKTSTMRLGADVVVFSCSRGKDGRSSTRSVGMLSYTFLRNTAKEDIVVPMLDYENTGQAQVWHKMIRSSVTDWNTNVETIVNWSPYASEDALLYQFNSMGDQGTRIVIYNLWEDDQGDLELDFDADKHDIQLGGINRDEKKIEMASQFPNSRHFLTYRHSLRSYASILYLRLPSAFRMILRGKEIEHHNLITDMMLKEQVTYRPQPGANGVLKDPDMVAVVTVGFVKDAKHHIDIQGFNVYHKNRLIKPFWRVWNAAGSDGRGVIGVMEANFVEPAHDKQGFERTTVLARLENRLIQMQKTYWTTNCHKIGYAPRRNKKIIQSEDRESSPEAPSVPPSSRLRRSGKDIFPSSTPLSKSQQSAKFSNSDEIFPSFNKTGKPSFSPLGSTKSVVDGIDNVSVSLESGGNCTDKFGKTVGPQQSRLHGSPLNDVSDLDCECHPLEGCVNGAVGSKGLPPNSFQTEVGRPSLSTSPYSIIKGAVRIPSSDEAMGNDRIATISQTKPISVTCNVNERSVEDSELRIKQLKDENENLKARITKMEEPIMQEREKNKLLTDELEAALKKVEDAAKEQEALIDIFTEERSRRDREEEKLKKKLKDASVTIQDLIEKLGSNQNNHKP